MRGLFKENIPLAELVLRIITGKPDLVLLKCETQADMKRVTGARSVCLDAYATDSTGKKYDIEVQRSDNGADPHRARYHSSMLDIEYRDNSDIGRLMHDFNCTNASDMYFDLLAEKTRYLKENPKGVSEVCKQMEDLRNESIFEGKILTLIDLVEDGTLTLDKAAAKAGMTVTQFKKEMEKVSLQIG